ncbi:hypothetical protein PILCRDRAFT_669665 [Piloderma croceum F 1598]|uniref:Uncharacterized protein n=1 Tax=Piloderma croceum (strain F 1598) TaxID=765440 RepID=A0A0C3ANS5_PILCF|nr:hypothetical protein PILCRDRAFT_669665 [Piloderma croceum F 1598]
MSAGLDPCRRRPDIKHHFSFGRNLRRVYMLVELLRLDPLLLTCLLLLLLLPPPYLRNARHADVLIVVGSENFWLVWACSTIFICSAPPDNPSSETDHLWRRSLI